MKKLLFPAILIISLMLSACQSQPASPAEIATFCADLTVFMKAVDTLVATDTNTSAVEFKAAYDAAVAAGTKLRESVKPIQKDPKVEELRKAVENLAVSIGYASETLPTAANYVQMMADIQQQYQALQVAYQDVQGYCAR